MSSRIPEPESSFEAEGLPDPGDTVPGQEVTGDTPEGLIVPRDHAIAADDFGTSAQEQAEGEDLTDRLAREEPDVLTDETVAHTPVGDDLDTPFHEPESVGRLVDDDEGARSDVTPETVAYDTGTEHSATTAEEAAMHIAPDEG